MRKILLTLLFLPIFVFAGLDIAKVNKTLSGIKSKKTLNFYTSNNKIKLNGNAKLTSFSNADIVLFSKKTNANQLAIVNSYKELKGNDKHIGAIYLRKGRTQIVFVKERLEMHGLRLSANLKKHLISNWQLDSAALLNNIK